MKFPASGLQINTLKEGLKITVYVEKDARREVLEQVHNFIDRPLEVDININAAGRVKELGQISGEQRKKIYAVLKDIDEYTGQGVESIKREMKKIFTAESGSEMFSLSDCDRELAGDFIEFLIGYCFENGISLSDHPADSLDDIEKYMYVCIDKKICAVCGEKAEIHHYDAIGMGG
ncbi:putative HNHc nuclease [Halarsenatibacter silvermanii]|uniref:Putative HNHc nuclease n=1 Tax=Halarsenatibacter silvermanii TaxID=321763 RepID=A0A1G9NLR6_9FIRM|nr:putative HNHc nuclease [Halarsenatibacter silvermanii]SDL87291.1 Putative HNHc nuclease [Halarsenatibacter silvermanii]